MSLEESPGVFWRVWDALFGLSTRVRVHCVGSDGLGCILGLRGLGCSIWV